MNPDLARAVARLANRPGPPGAPDDCRRAAEALRRFHHDPSLVGDWGTSFARLQDRHEQHRFSPVLGLTQVHVTPRRGGRGAYVVLHHQLLPGRQFLDLTQLISALEARAGEAE